MDALDPEIEEIDGCMYRINPIEGYNGKTVFETHYEEFDDQDAEYIAESEDNEYDDLRANIIYEKDWYKISLHIPMSYIPFVCGKRGGTKQRLEKETKSFLNFNQKTDADNVDSKLIAVIKSRYKGAAFTAYRRLLALIETVRSKEMITHFLAIPMSTNETKQKFLLFKEIVMDEFGHDRGICKELFQKPEKMHATIAVFTLVDHFERQTSIDALQECQELFIDPYFKNKQPLFVRMKGVECMNDDPSEVNVLFGKMTLSDNKLQNLADNIAQYFKEKHIYFSNRERVKLHVTLMNTKFLQYSNGKAEGEKGESVTFDARNIIKHFENFDFGEVQVDSLCLCQAHSTAEDGFFLISSKVNLN